jgi:ABC-type transport system involved in cytochrome c biogenesis permease subunit
MDTILGFLGLLVLLLLGVAWVVALVRLLWRADLDSTMKICWVVVLCTLTLLGLILFALFGPRRPRRMQRVRRVYEPPKKESAVDENRTSA